MALTKCSFLNTLAFSGALTKNNPHLKAHRLSRRLGSAGQCAGDNVKNIIPCLEWTFQDSIQTNSPHRASAKIIHPAKPADYIGAGPCACDNVINFGHRYKRITGLVPSRPLPTTAPPPHRACRVANHTPKNTTPHWGWPLREPHPGRICRTIEGSVIFSSPASKNAFESITASVPSPSNGR